MTSIKKRRVKSRCCVRPGRATQRWGDHVEDGASIARRWTLARLRNVTCFSIAE
jgi:hypothetical protein